MPRPLRKCHPRQRPPDKQAQDQQKARHDHDRQDHQSALQFHNATDSNRSTQNEPAAEMALCISRLLVLPGSRMIDTTAAPPGQSLGGSPRQCAPPRAAQTTIYQGVTPQDWVETPRWRLYCERLPPSGFGEGRTQMGREGPGTKAQRERLRRTMQQQGCTTEEIASEMAQ